MFDWLFEKRVKGTLFFKVTCGKHFDGLYMKALDYVCEVRKITMQSEGAIVYRRYLTTQMVQDRFVNDVNLSLNANIIDGVNAEERYENGGEVEFRIEVECWEGAWKKLEKLPWVTGTAKAC